MVAEGKEETIRQATSPLRDNNFFKVGIGSNKPKEQVIKCLPIIPEKNKKIYF